MFSTGAQGRFPLTPFDAVLQSDVPGAARSTVVALSGAFFWTAWAGVLNSAATSETGMQKVLRVSEYEYLAEAYNSAGSGTVVDVGGGSDSLLVRILPPI